MYKTGEKWYRKTTKIVGSRCLKNRFQLNFWRYGIISSPTSTSLLQIFENLNLRRTYSTSVIGLLQETPFYCKNFCWIDNSVRRLLLLKIVLHSLFADALYGLWPNSAYTDPFWSKCGGSVCIKNLFFHSGRDNFKAKVSH